MDLHGLLQIGVHERVKAFRCVRSRGVPVTRPDLELHEVYEHLPQERQLAAVGDLSMVVLEVGSGAAQIAGPHRERAHRRPREDQAIDSAQRVGERLRLVERAVRGQAGVEASVSGCGQREPVSDVGARLACPRACAFAVFHGVAKVTAEDPAPRELGEDPGAQLRGGLISQILQRALEQRARARDVVAGEQREPVERVSAFRSSGQGAGDVLEQLRCPLGVPGLEEELRQGRRPRLPPLGHGCGGEPDREFRQLGSRVRGAARKCRIGGTVQHGGHG
jgi:hypothetical protein